jgi:hypothetical protein
MPAIFESIAVFYALIPKFIFMLESLIGLVKEYGQQHVVENPEVPNEYNERVMAEASYAVAGQLQSALANGQVQDVASLFGNDEDEAIMSNPLAQNMQSGFVNNITSKLGINKNVAIGLAGTLLPMIISQFVKRTRSTAPQDSGFDLGGLISSLTGGGGGNASGLNIASLISQFAGGGAQHGSQGGFDISGILNQLQNGARENQGSLSDVIHGFFQR